MKTRIEPHHNLFTAFGQVFKNKLNFSYNDKNVQKYLKGETLDVDIPDGYAAFMINDCSVGGFKMSKGQFKNLYPKGFRNFK